MNIDLPVGRYVIAVSGGVDSMVLLDVLRRIPDMRLTVAHMDHGIRPDSAEDRRLVHEISERHGLPFVYHEAHLGPGASEAMARKVRYDFLRQVQQASGASAIVTAHHQDDLLETVVMNLLRGTGRRGLSSLKSTPPMQRPLLNVPKADLYAYAKAHGLRWHEDCTNTDEAYLRNYIRHRLLPRFGSAGRQKLLAIANTAAGRNAEIDAIVEQLLQVHAVRHQLDRHEFIVFSHRVAMEVMAAWLRMQTDVELTRATLERLVVAAKTGRIGSSVDINRTWVLKITEHSLALVPRER